MADEEPKKDAAAADSTAKEESSGPSADAKPKVGSVGLADKAGSSLASVVAASSLSTAARTIAREVRAAAGERTVVIVEDRAVAVSDIVLADVENAIGALDEIVDMIERLVVPPKERGLLPAPGPNGEGAVQGAPEEEPAPAKEAVAPLDALKQLGDLIGLFRSTFDVAPQAIGVDRTALIAAVAGLLASPGADVEGHGAGQTSSTGVPTKVVMPTMASVAAAPILVKAKRLLIRRHTVGLGLGLLDAQNEPTSTELARARAYRDSLVVQRDKAVIDGDSKKVEALTALIERAIGEIARAASDATYQMRRAKVETAKAMLAAVESQVATLTNASDTGSSRLVQAALREQVHRQGGDKPAVLWLDVTATGGDSVTKQSPLGWNSEASFLGAVQAVYLLVSSDGQVLASGAKESFGYKTFDFDDFFDGSSSVSGRRNMQFGYEAAEILAIGLVLLLAVVVVALIVR